MSGERGAPGCERSSKRRQWRVRGELKGKSLFGGRVEFVGDGTVSMDINSVYPSSVGATVVHGKVP